MELSTEVLFIINIILSLSLGFLLGREREIRHKEAGVGTNTFVVMGSMLFTFLSTRVDPLSTSRIAAGMITGIGFLGAGIIIQKGSSVRNLTTAASIWFAAGIGMAIGYEYHLIAIIATFMGLLIPHLPHFKDYRQEEPKAIQPRKKPSTRKRKT